MPFSIDLVTFFGILAAVAVFFGGLGYWMARQMTPSNGDVPKLRLDIAVWRVEDRHQMRNEMHVYISPTLDKVDDVEKAFIQIRERLVTVEANQRRKP